MTITAMIPTAAPALKIPATTEQLLNMVTNNKTATGVMTFFIVISVSGKVLFISCGCSHPLNCQNAGCNTALVKARQTIGPGNTLSC